MFDPIVTFVMLFLGLLLGFVGLAGSGFIAALLIVLFGVPVHLAFGTALGAAFVASSTGGWSHLREGNVDPVIAVQVGLAGIVGAYVGSGLALSTGGGELKVFSGLMLMINSGVVYVRTRRGSGWVRKSEASTLSHRWWKELPSSAFIGFTCGLLTGLLSIGVAPWIQVGLLYFKGTDLPTTIGTTMLSLALSSITGASRFAMAGQLDIWLLVSVIAGLSAGTFVGARYTRRAPRGLVRMAMLVTPFAAGTLLVFGPGG